MAFTAREIVFYLRAEDQASRVVKRVAGSFGSLKQISNIQSQIGKQNYTNYKAIEQSQMRVLANAKNIAAAQVQASRLNRLVANKQPVRGYTLDETGELANVANQRVQLLQRNMALLEKDQEQVALSAKQASAALDAELSAAKVARQEQIITGFQNIARAARLMGVVVGASLLFAAHQAANFQTQLTLAASQARPVGAGAGATTAIAGKLQGVVLAQMQKFPATSQEMADALYQIFSSTNIQNIKAAGTELKTFNEAAVAGGTDLGTMANAGITLQNNFVGANNEFKTLNGALEVFFSAVRFGRMNATQFANSLSYVAGIAKEAGLKFTDVADAMATLTRQTGSTRTNQDAQGLARLIQQFANPDFIAGAKKLGVEVIDPTTKKLKPLLDIITQISKKADLRGVNALNFFKQITALGGGGAGNKGTIQAQRAFAYLVNNLKEYGKVSQDVNTDNNEFIKSFQALSKSPGVEFQVVLNQLKALVIVIGTQAIPAIVRLAQPLVKLLQYFNNLSESTKHTIAQVGVYGSAFAVLGGTIVILVGTVSKLILTLKLLKFAKLAEDTGSVGLRFSALLGVVGLLVYAFIKYHKQIDSVVNAMGGWAPIIAGVSAALVILSLRFDTVGVAALGAEGKVAGLLGKLSALALVTIPTIVIPIVTKVSNDLGSSKRPNQQVIKYHGILGNTLGRLGATAEYGVNRLLGKTPAQARQAVINDVNSGGASPGVSVGFSAAPKSILKQFNAITASPWVTIPILQQAVAAYKRGDYKTISALYAAVVTQPRTQAARSAGVLYKDFDKIFNFGQNVAKNALSSSKAATVKQNTWQQLFTQVIAMDKVIKSEKMPSRAELEKYDNLLDKLQKKSTGNQFQSAEQYLSELESIWSTADKTSKKHTKNLQDQAKKQEALLKQNIANAKSQIGDLESGIQSMYDNLLQQNQSNFGDLFNGPFMNSPFEQNVLAWGGKVTGTDELKDLKSQLHQFNLFNRQLGTLKKRGASSSLISQLQTLGPGNEANVKALMQLSPSQWKQYVETWNRSQTVIKNTTMRQLKSQLKIYEQHGRNIASAIIRGITSQDTQLTKVFKNLIDEMFPGLVKQANQNPHPKRKTTTRTTTSATGSGTVNIHVHGKPTSDQITQTKHLAFRLRNGGLYGV